MALASRAFKGDPRLEACAVSDPAHVTPGSVGDHVGKIQAALIDLDGASIDPNEIAARRYGITTTARVVDFKTARNILNFLNKIDNIVGKKTIAAMDGELKAREGTLPPPPPPPPTPALPIGDGAQAAKARAEALRMVTVANLHVTSFQLDRDPGRLLDLQKAAFNNHYKLVLAAADIASHRPATRVFDPLRDRTFIPKLRENFTKLAATLADDSKWLMVTEAQARAEGGVNAAPPGVVPGIVAGYVVAPNTPVRITPVFNQPTRGPFCQIAIVIHEALHVTDALSGIDNVTHIPEWASADPPINGRFGDTSYDRQSPDNAIHNPSAYASFAIHLSRGRDERFGDGRRTE